MTFVLKRSWRRRTVLVSLGALLAATLLSVLFNLTGVSARPLDPLPSWNAGAAKESILRFVAQTTDRASAEYVPPEQRIASFDQDGTLWVEQPMYTQAVYILERVQDLVKTRPELAQQEPYATVLSGLAGNRQALKSLSVADIETLAATTLTGMPVDTFKAEVAEWLAKARHPRWQRPYTELTYQPMQELLKFLRSNDYRTYIVTGGGQDFVRVFAEDVYGVPPEQVIGSAGSTRYGYTSSGQPFLTKEPKLLLDNNNAGKPEAIHLMIGRRPTAAFGNSTGDRQMLEYTKAGPGSRLAMLVLHDDAHREYAYGPAQGLPASKVGTFTQELHDEAMQKGWLVVSMKNDWKQIFSFER